MTKTEQMIRNSDPRFIDWRYFCVAGGLTESLIREYKDYIWDRIDWLEIGIRCYLSEDFKREMKDKLDIYGE